MPSSIALVLTGHDGPCTCLDGIDEPMRRVDAARPISGKILMQGLRHADPLEWRSQRVLDQRVDARERLAVLALPVQVIVPGGRRPEQAASGTGQEACAQRVGAQLANRLCQMRGIARGLA